MMFLNGKAEKLKACMLGLWNSFDLQAPKTQLRAIVADFLEGTHRHARAES